MLVSMVNNICLVNNTRKNNPASWLPHANKEYYYYETCLETGITVSDSSFRVIKSIAWFRRIRRGI